MSGRDTSDIEDKLKSIRKNYKECLASILVEREEVDPRITDFEECLHDLNERRAKFYGRDYNPPEVLYLNRVEGLQRSTEINKAIEKMGLTRFGKFDETAARYVTLGNWIIAFVNNFDDEDVDRWNTCRLFLSHYQQYENQRRKKVKYPLNHFCF
ncbi:MAG: hypothetical protein N2691_04255 [Patescibacteria group bacterium]|nr:hypothetical protein [Patescibacteria group bacterium]